MKTGGFRDVPIHPHLIEMGVLAFAKDHRAGPLFYNAARSRGGGAANPPYKKVGGRIAAWVREIGVNDPDVQPNHGWRHRMSSVLTGLHARQVEIDAILGHKGSRYGKVDMRVKRALINRIPRVELDPAIAAKQARDWRIEALEEA